MAKTVKMWRRRTPQQWQGLLERQAASGQSVEAFCRSEAVTTASFYRWRRRLGGPDRATARARAPQREATPPFVDLGTLDGGSERTTVGGGWELELALGASVVLRLRGG